MTLKSNLIYLGTAVTIIVSQNLNSLMTEQRFRQRYDGEKFGYSTIMLIALYIFPLVLACIGKVVSRESHFRIFGDRNLLLSCLFIMLGNECSIQTSLRLSYLLQMLIRSCKFLSVLLSVFIFRTDGHEGVTTLKMGMAAFFTVAIFVFHMGDHHKGAANEISGFLFGLLSLVCDCCVSHFQVKFKKHHKTSYWDLVQGSYAWCLILSIGLSFLKMEMFPALDFMTRHPRVIVDLMVNEIVNSLSLLVIFYHVHTFGPVSMAKLASIRKAMSVVVSIVAFGHVLNGYRTAGLVMMSIVMGYEAYLNFTKPAPIKEKSA
jgi:hypothetical protein